MATSTPPSLQLERPSRQKVFRPEKINGVSKGIKGQGRTSLQGEVANTGIVRTVLHFADDAPQQFEQPDRSLRPTMATIHAIY